MRRDDDLDGLADLDLSPEEIAMIMGDVQQTARVNNAQRPANQHNASTVLASAPELELDEIELAMIAESEREEEERIQRAHTEAVKLKQATFFKAVKTNDLNTLLDFSQDSEVSIRAVNNSRQDPFDYAVQFGAVASLELLLSLDTSRIHETDQFGNYLVHTAAIANSVECMAVLHRAGADLKKTNRVGHCPLLFSIYNGKLAMAEYLVSALMIRQPTDPDQQYRAGYFPTAQNCTLRLDSVNHQNDLVLLRVFSNHALSCNRDTPQVITWRDFVLIALGYQFDALKKNQLDIAEQKLQLAKQICLLELLCQKVHLTSQGKLKVDGVVRMQECIEKMVDNLSSKQDQEFENKDSIANLCKHLKSLQFSDTSGQLQIKPIQSSIIPKM